MRFWILISLLSFLNTELYTQANFHVEVNRMECAVGDELQVTIHCENFKPESYSPPDFSGFEILSGPNKMERYEWVNGKESNTISYQYLISPKKTGALQIGIAKATFKNKTFQSIPITIQVSKSNSVLGGAANQDADFLVECKVHAQKMYVGQQVLVEFILYTRVNIQELYFQLPQNISGCTMQELNTMNTPEFKITRNGRQYLGKVIRRMVIYPQIAGDILIPSVRGAAMVDHSTSIFGGFDLDRVPFQTNSVQAVAKDLPAPPPGFTGAVGNFQLNCSITPDQISMDDAATLTLIIQGNGNPSTILPPRIHPPSGMDVYAPKLKNEYQKEHAQGIQSTKTFSYALLPENTGNHTISTQFVFFNPESGTYETLTSNPLSLQVTAGNGKSAAKKILQEPTAQSEVKSNIPKWAFLLGILGFIGLLIFRFRKHAEAKKEILSQPIKEEKKVLTKNSIPATKPLDLEPEPIEKFSPPKESLKELSELPVPESQDFSEELFQWWKLWARHQFSGYEANQFPTDLEQSLEFQKLPEHNKKEMISFFLNLYQSRFAPLATLDTSQLRQQSLSNRRLWENL